MTTIGHATTNPLAVLRSRTVRRATTTTFGVRSVSSDSILRFTGLSRALAIWPSASLTSDN
ncbi:hypothetical protein ABZ341_13465 [Streptomyces sp. NPDC006173]|uniref:hypothetical protein n=1 Tax=Streptomyces sp. NPDC006173 TaxID=3155349 RepID=UPI00340C7E78